jgi:hypothetical protein
MLIDRVSRNPKDLPRAIREFANRTAMLRDCGFAHIGAMLAWLLSADVQGGPDYDAMAIPSAPVTTATVGSNRSALTEKQAIAIGCAIASSVHEAHALAAGLKRAVTSHAVLQAMKSEYAWFVPMLKVVMAHKAAQPRGSVVMNRLRSSIAPVAAIDVASDADRADEEGGFSSVVRLGAHGPRLAVCPLASDALRPKACFSPAYGEGTPPQVPTDAKASELVDSTLIEPAPAVVALGSASHFSRDVGSGSEVPGFAQWPRAPRLARFAIRYYFVRTPRTCAGPRRSEQ